MRCSKCGAENPEGLNFCNECATPFSRRCATCEFENAPTAKFCGKCAAPLTASESRADKSLGSNQAVRIASEADSRVVGDGERKTVTALFADIKGSMEMMEDLDPEEARTIVDPALKLMIDAVRRYDGYIVQSTGDGIFALFGAPVAHEDHAQRALYAALRIHDENRHYADKLRSDGRSPLQIRIGVDTGEVVVRTIETGGKTEYTPIGHAANLASRMQSLANPGSTVISESTRKLVEGYFTLRPLGASRVKGIADPINVYELTGLGPLRTRLQRSAVRGYTKFVGRQREMDAMKHAAEQAKAGHGQIIAAIADAGVGKSRLFFEFKATSQSGWLVLEAPSFFHGKATAYMPVLDFLHGYFRITPDDDQRARREKVNGRIVTLDPSLENTRPHLFALLGIAEGEDPFAQMDAQVRRRRTQDAIKRVLLRESLNQPLMLIFEDLHWIDDETQAFLNLLAEGIANAPMLMLVNYRPEYTHQWGSKTYYTQLRLDPLGKESADEMLNALLIGDSPELAPLKRLVLERTEGNPLFMEELVHALFDEGVLVRNGMVRLTRSPSQLKIPPTVQGILAARIDRLPVEEKELLQTLAVIGMEFPFALAREVVKKPDDQLDHMLNNLQLAEFIYEQPAAGDIEYKFKHALTRDVAYNSMLIDRRKLLHERTGQAIEALYHDRLDDRYADLAHHYRSSSNSAKAIEYLRLAGEQAVARGVYEQALANVELALKLIERLPQGAERLRAELGVYLMEGMTVTAMYGMASTERLQIFARVCQLSESLGDAPALFRGLLNRGFAHAHRFEALRALEIARQCVKLAQEDLSEMLPAANALLAQALHRSGDLPQADSVGRDAMNCFASPHQRAALSTPANLWAVIPLTLANVEQALGRPDEALKFGEEALRRARQLKHSLTLAGALHTACLLRYQRREPEAAHEKAEALIALAEEHGFREYSVQGKGLRDWAMTERGHTEPAVTELEALVRSSGRFLLLSKAMLLATVYLRVRRADEALAIVGKELDELEELGAHQEAAELHRLKGEAILIRDSLQTAEAEACFRKAIEIAQGQSAKWWELRATTTLARLLRDTGRRNEARAMLADIYNWFTEGFDTADLKEAKALLEELTLRGASSI